MELPALPVRFSLPRFLAGFCIALLIAVPALAATPRQVLMQAAFSASDKETALVRIGKAEEAATAILARNPKDREALLIRAMAIGYQAKLTRSRGDAITARRMFDMLATADPGDPEAHALVGGWHIDAISELGGLVAGAALGAKKSVGLEALDRAVTLGGDRAMFPGLAMLLRLSLNPKDAQAERLAARAARAATPFELDRIMQRAAATMATTLKTGDSRTVQAMAKRLLPFGGVEK